MTVQQRIGVFVLIVCAVAATSVVTAETNLAIRLHRAIRAAGVLIDGVSIGDPATRSTWTVSPSTLQGAAQPTIDAFNPLDPNLAIADADARTDALFADVVDDVLTALIEQWPAIQAEAAAGTLTGNAGAVKQRIRNRVRALRRAKPPNP